jgi:glycosyltransferase involved in cell wall biosynthesis
MLPTRLLWHKGVGVFVEAAERLQEEGMSARFVLVGDRDSENPATVPLKRLKGWESEGIVEWWGGQASDDMPEVLGQADVVCLPSYYREGVPKVLIEAASCGRPIVTTDVPGCREIVQDGENGMLVPAKDAGALADRVRILLRNQELRQEMGREGRRRVKQHFTAQRVADQIVGAYDRLLARDGSQK